MRATGLLDQAKYISAVSGGTWAAAPFVFLPETISDDEFLGEELVPADISLERLRGISRRSLAYAISDTGIVDDLLSEAVRLAGDETFSRAIGNLFLEPFGLGDNGKFITQDTRSRSRILRRNRRVASRNTYLKEDDFYLPRSGRPYFIMNGTILTGNSTSEKFPFEMTPLYSGTRHYFPGDDAVGGGYVEPLGYDSLYKRRKGDTLTLKLASKKHIFSLTDMIGASGAAPQAMLYKLHLRSIGLPEFRHLAFAPNGGFGDAEELSHGDGGHLDNLGMMPLLARQVRNILVFVNSKTKFVLNPDPDKPEKSKMASSIGNMFRPHSNGFDANVVFEDPHGDLAKLGNLAKGLEQRQQARRSLIWCDEYQVGDNPKYSIEAYGPVKICWVYNQNVGLWRDGLDYQVEKVFETRELKRFPHYATFFENFGRLIDLSRVQAGLLAHMACWSLRQEEPAIRGLFGF